MAIIIDGKMTAKKIKEELKYKVKKLKESGKIPKLAVILVGNDEASKIYVHNKSKACEEIGIEYEEWLLPESTNMNQLLQLIEKLNKREDVSGILLQSPIPNHLDIKTAFNAIAPKKDVDGFNPTNIGMLEINNPTFVSCTPLGIIKMLEEYNIEIEGKTAVIMGRSNIVGKPLIQLLLNKNATVIVTHSKTKKIEELTKIADILISSIGRPKFVKENMVKKGAIIIDVGINRDKETGKIVGDVDYENVSKKARYITPVPGGVGPMTIAMLMNNVVIAAEVQNK